MGGIAAAGCRRDRPAGFAGYAFVANRAGRALAAVDLTVFAVARHLTLDDEPTEVVTHAARPTVYALTPRSGAVYEVGADRLQIQRRARLGGESSHMRLQPDGEALWVVNQSERRLMRVSLNSFQVESVLHLPSEASDLRIAPGGEVLALGLSETGQVALFDILNRRALALVQLGGPVGRVAFRSDGRVLMAANWGQRSLDVINVEMGAIAVRLPIEMEAQYFALKPDGGQLFLAGRGSDAVVTVYPFRTEIGGAVLAGGTPGHMTALDSPDYLFVTNPERANVTVLNIRNQRVVAVATVGAEPCFAIVTPNAEYALVLNRGSGDMAVLHIPTISRSRARSAPLFTMIPVGSQPVSAVIRGV